ncbi:protein kinase domain-containing protein [Haloferula sp.]|uniref:protein kinase domain-containing protein n=1 Tax=Haloferula sp. TaxID=2497595 RepID=UPI003C75BAAC
MTTNDPLTCPDCGTLLPVDSPQQLCPSCLLKQAFASRTVDAPTEPASPPPTPEEIADKFPQFEITECLGRGGMGVVYKARQKSLNRWVAIKILAPEKIHDEKFAERFTREAQTLALLNHPNIVTVHDYGETDGLFYIVMEFVDGVNLRDLIREGKMESAQALTIIPPICEALQYAHDKGIVHRDIKPENLLIDRDGRVKIADFGIASLVGDTDEKSGTPPYMAPEQGNHGNVDHRADIYALGAVLYEMLTGDRPASPLDLPSQKVQLDIRIDDIVLRALSKEPERRYRTAGEFQSVVETVVDQLAPPSTTAPTQETSQAQTPPQATPQAPVKKGLFRRWWWIFLIFGILTPLAAAAAFLLFAYLMPRDFEASTLILIQESEPAAQLSTNRFPTYIAGITSQATFQKVSEELDLSQRWMLNEAETITRLGENTSVHQRRGTDLLDITVRSRERQFAPEIANTIASAYAERSKSIGLSVWVIERASIGRTYHIEPKLRLGLILSVPIGLLLSPLLAWMLAAFLHRFIPHRASTAEASQRQKERDRTFGRLALGLILLGILGTVAMLPFTHQDELVLVFGAVALGLGLIFGLFTRWRLLILVLLLVGSALGLITFLGMFLFYQNKASSVQKHQQRAQTQAIHEQEILVQEELRRLERAPRDTTQYKDVAQAFLRAIKAMDPETAHSLRFLESELTKQRRSQMLTDFQEMKTAYKEDLGLLTTVLEWHRMGGYAICRVAPPKGDDHSIFMILGIRPDSKEWRIIEVNDIRSNELLPKILGDWLEDQE